LIHSSSHPIPHSPRPTRTPMPRPQVSLNLKSTNVKTLVAHAVKMQSMPAKTKGVSLQHYVDKRIPDLVMIDEFHLKKIINNLVSNAIKFTPPEGEVFVSLKCGFPDPKPQQTVTIGTCPIRCDATCSNGIVLEVQDSGCGIPKSKLHTIFEAYKQASKTTVRNYGGTGLGLSIVKKTVEQFKGCIYIKSKLDEGATMAICIPCRPSKHTEKPAETKHGVGRSKVQLPPRTRLLVAEDHKMSLALLRRWLRKMDVKGVIYCINGEELIEQARSTLRADPQGRVIVFTDIHMPKVGGPEAAKQILELPWAHRPLVAAMTASPEDLNEKKGDVIFDVVHRKPMSQPIVHSTLERFCSLIAAQQKGVT